MSDTLPLGRNRAWGAGATGAQYPPGQYPSAFPRIVDHRYLETMKIPLVSGRYFDARDDAKAPKSVVINQNLARQLWPGQDAIGQRMDVIGGVQVIGVVANVRHATLEEAGGNEMYLDYRQTNSRAILELVVRSTRPVDSLMSDVRAALTAHHPAMPTGERRPAGRRRRPGLRAPRPARVETRPDGDAADRLTALGAE